MKRIKAVVFDLDGTLLNTIGDLSENLNRVLARRGLPVHPVEKYKIMVGRGLRNLTQAAVKGLNLDSGEFEALFEEFQKEYKLHPADYTEPYEGIEEMLVTLADKCTLFILSNKEHKMTHRVVEEILSGHSFQEIHGMKEGVPGKPDPTVLKNLLSGYNLDPDEVLYLGDSDVDMETARGGGVMACGALWGFRDRSELEKAGCQEFFETPRAFRDYALKLME